MGNRLFRNDIAGKINRAMAKLMLPATLVKSVPGTRTAGSLTGGTNPTATSYACRGFIDSYTDGQVDGTVVRSGDRMVSLFGDSIERGAVVPEAGDRIEIEGSTFTVVGVKRDPDKALYTCQVRN